MVYKCGICGYVFDEEKEGRLLPDLDACPMCASETIYFKPTDGAGNTPAQPAPQPAAAPAGQARNPLDYPADRFRLDETERAMDDIHEMARTGKPIIAAMGVSEVQPCWDCIHILGAQLDPMPLDEHAPVSLQTVIGKNAAKPLVMELPVFVSHMSFGALSREAKIALAKGSALAKTAMCSGEGGILPDELANAYRYIFEYVPNRYSATDENLQRADAIEIKIGQGTKPGMGGHLPGEKVTGEIAEIRQKPLGQDVISPSTFPDVATRDDLKALVDGLRLRSGGRPVGVKIAAGHIENDLAFALHAKPDFITLDGRGGATGASPKLVRNATSVPTIYALHRARKYLDSVGADVQLIITGGLRTSADIVKALAMGADAVAIASAALMAIACQQYKICQSGLCPMGVATQDEALRSGFDIEASAQRLHNFLKATAEELATFARITAHGDIHALNIQDLCTIDRDIAEFAGIPHA